MGYLKGSAWSYFRYYNCNLTAFPYLSVTALWWCHDRYHISAQWLGNLGNMLELENQLMTTAQSPEMLKLFFADSFMFRNLGMSLSLEDVLFNWCKLGTHQTLVEITRQAWGIQMKMACLPFVHCLWKTFFSFHLTFIQNLLQHLGFLPYHGISV